MPLQRLEICVGMLKLVVEFVVVVAESVGIVIHQNDSNRSVATTMLRRSNPAAPSVPLLGGLAGGAATSPRILPDKAPLSYLTDRKWKPR
ncbi:hypothetical protein V6N13_106077 [Hibiscus sabdariffa]|uniref:Secreted protein n=1 Tax=Hibiscus sabdariffa TaxID=183260 RepID=A0ABR2EZK5_9ROSI